MRISNPLLHKLGGLLASGALRAWMATLDYKVVYHDAAIDPIFPECQGQKIYIFWHEYIAMPIFLRGRCNFTMLLSRHRDAEILARGAYHLGFDFIRGSTARGGVAALRQMLRRSRRMHLTITPDGPRGPRRHLAPGCVYLASRLGLPLVAMGFGYDRPWRVHSWDRFAIPKPYSRARAVTSRPIHVPPGLDRAALEDYRQRVETLLNQLTIEAETWAESKKRRAEQQRLFRAGAPLPSGLPETSRSEGPWCLGAPPRPRLIA